MVSANIELRFPSPSLCFEYHYWLIFSTKGVKIERVGVKITENGANIIVDQRYNFQNYWQA
ncbi:hypothetical protein NBRC116494_14190 [Aurantivibrio plasticivorans]